MDFFSSSYTIARDDSMSSSYPDNEKMTIPDNQTKYQFEYFGTSYNQNQQSDQTLVHHQSFTQNLQQPDYLLYPQRPTLIYDQDQLHTKIDCATVLNEQNSSYDSSNFMKGDLVNSKSFSSTAQSVVDSQMKTDKYYYPICHQFFKDQSNSDYTQLTYVNQQQPTHYNYQNQQSSQKLEQAPADRQNQQNGFNQQMNGSKQIINHSNGKNIYSNNPQSQIQESREESQSSSVNSIRQNVSQEMEENQQSMNISMLKTEEQPSKINYSQESLSFQNYNSDLELDNEQQQIVQQKEYNNIQSVINNNNNKYSITIYNKTNENNTIEINQEINPNFVQIQQPTLIQNEVLISRDYSFTNIQPSESAQEISGKQNKFLIEGGIIIDLNEFLNQSENENDSFITTLNQFYYFSQIQKLKKYVVGQVEFKTKPITNFAELLKQLEQFNQINENAAKLSKQLIQYQKYIQDRIEQHQEKFASTLILDNQVQSQTYSSDTNTFLNQNPSLMLIPSHPQINNHQKHSSSLILESQNQLSSNTFQVDPYNSIARANFNLRQADKILKQFEKFCYSFKIIRKSPVTIESLQMGVSTSLIELLGLDTNESIAVTLRNIPEGMLPFDYAGNDASNYAIDEIYQIITSLKEKQKYYNRKQSLQYGELKHSQGKSLKVKIQSKVFLLNTYTPLNNNTSANSNKNFCEDLIGDYLEIKLYTPECTTVQKISKKRTSSSRQGFMNEEECLKMDKSERCSVYIEKVNNLMDKFYNDESLLSPEHIFRKKWIVKSNKQSN